MKRLLTPALLMTVLLLTGCGCTDRYREPEFPTERSARFELIGEPLTLRDAGDI